MIPAPPQTDDEKHVECISCPLCREVGHSRWADENGYTAVKCSKCGLIYVNPRPCMALISQAVRTGVHTHVDHKRSVIGRRVSKKVRVYRKLLETMFADVWNGQRTVRWLDVGAGYGEVVEAVSTLAGPQSTVDGLEPMAPKAQSARARGFSVTEGYLSDVAQQYGFVSLVNVFSHIPDFHGFLQDVNRVLEPNGEMFIETGNIADLDSPHDVPTDLNLPDHLVFAGEQHIHEFLGEAGFSVVCIMKKRRDGFLNAAKNVGRKFMGRPVTLSLPYTLEYRSLLIRARKLSR